MVEKSTKTSKIYLTYEKLLDIINGENFFEIVSTFR